ncbi:hypothetical protein SLEP1_g52074 [Rubroshorea leprosula]|uniref:Uncharacterized protein n=1 Tax=Rubroshorea leprosula TaxID=152421 RepID=A0AAV5M6U9_9ROSI|nr:hypothetical protein SLEP1_g52074 [Rubroshorea leprosula]
MRMKLRRTFNWNFREIGIRIGNSLWRNSWNRNGNEIGVGLLGSPFPQCSLPGWPASGWSKTWSDARSLASAMTVAESLMDLKGSSDGIGIEIGIRNGKELVQKLLEKCFRVNGE